MTQLFEMPSDIATVFLRPLASDPEHEALVTRRGRWSYRQLDHACACAAGALRAVGVGPGDRVAAILPNEVDIIVAFHAAMRLGAIWVGVNQALAVPEQSFLLQDSGASVLVCTDAAAASFASRRALPTLRTVVTESQWRDAVEHQRPLRDLPAVDPHGAAGLAYTSGTTGRPKGAILSQHNLLVPGAMLVEDRGYDASLRKGDCLPLTILNLMVLTTLLVAQAGGTTVIMDQMYAQGVADWVEREAVTVWNGPPPILHTMVEDRAISAVSLASLREAWSGGAALPEALRNRFAAKFATPVIGTYGLTEAPTVVSLDPPDGRHVAGASGRVLPHLDVTIDPGPPDASPARDTGADAGPSTGEICIGPVTSGPFADRYRPPLGYWERPEASAATFVGGVVRTGDVGFVDRDGWLHIRDRKNLVIVRGGANVYPAEVERVLHAIAGISASAVVGVPDERLGERVVAVVELDIGAAVDPDEIIERCAAELARYKVPERVIVVDRLPRNAMGKVDRPALAPMVGER